MASAAHAASAAAKRFHRFNFLMRSDGVMMSVRRIHELVVDHHDFALCDQAAVDQHVHWFAGQAVEFHHRPLSQLQQVANRDLGAPEFTPSSARGCRESCRCHCASRAPRLSDKGWNTPADEAVAGVSLPFCSASALAQSSMPKSSPLSGSVRQRARFSLRHSYPPSFIVSVALIIFWTRNAY